MTGVTAPQRLHPWTVLFEMARVFGRFAAAIAIVLLARLLGGPSEWGELVLIGLGSFGVLVALARYATLRYTVENGALVIRSGLVFRQLRTVPLDRVQNVDLRQTLLQRAAHVVDLRIETAAGEGAEVRLALLSEDAARRLAEVVAAGGRASVPAAAGDVGSGPPPPPPLWAATPGALTLLGATQNRAGAILGALFGLYFFAGQVLGDRVNRFGISGDMLARVPGPLALALGFGALVLLLGAGWLLSIGGTLVRYWGFTLGEDVRGRLTRSFGLLTRRQSVIPLGRIQVLRVEANWPRRLLGYWTAFVATAGSRVDNDAGGESLLCPIIGEREVGPLARRIFAALDLDRADWRPVSVHAVRRAFLRVMVLVAALAAAAAFTVGPAGWLLLLPGAPLAYAWARARWRALAWSNAGGLLLARSGVWRRRIVVVPEGKIQALTVVASPFQRRLGIASLVVATAAAGAPEVTVVDLPTRSAAELERRLTLGAARAGAWLPDGV